MTTLSTIKTYLLRNKIDLNYDKKHYSLKKKHTYKEYLQSNQKISLLKKFQHLYKKFAQTRIKNRCWKTGNTRSTYRMFGLSRHALRLLSHECALPGVTKASW